MRGDDAANVTGGAAAGGGPTRPGDLGKGDQTPSAGRPEPEGGTNMSYDDAELIPADWLDSLDVVYLDSTKAADQRRPVTSLAGGSERDRDTEALARTDLIPREWFDRLDAVDEDHRSSKRGTDVSDINELQQWLQEDLSEDDYVHRTSRPPLLRGGGEVRNVHDLVDWLREDQDINEVARRGPVGRQNVYAGGKENDPFSVVSVESPPVSFTHLSLSCAQPKVSLQRLRVRIPLRVYLAGCMGSHRRWTHRSMCYFLTLELGMFGSMYKPPPSLDMLGVGEPGVEFVDESEMHSGAVNREFTASPQAPVSAFWEACDVLDSSSEGHEQNSVRVGMGAHSAILSPSQPRPSNRRRAASTHESAAVSVPRRRTNTTAREQSSVKSVKSVKSNDPRVDKFGAPNGGYMALPVVAAKVPPKPEGTTLVNPSSSSSRLGDGVARSPIPRHLVSPDDDSGRSSPSPGNSRGLLLAGGAIADGKMAEKPSLVRTPTTSAVELRTRMGGVLRSKSLSRIPMARTPVRPVISGEDLAAATSGVRSFVGRPSSLITTPSRLPQPGSLRAKSVLDAPVDSGGRFQISGISTTGSPPRGAAASSISTPSRIPGVKLAAAITTNSVSLANSGGNSGSRQLAARSRSSSLASNNSQSIASGRGTPRPKVDFRSSTSLSGRTSNTGYVTPPESQGDTNDYTET